MNKANLEYWIDKDGKILIVGETRPGKALWWELPGGKISKADQNLLPIESLARELQEELGDDFWILSWNPELFMVYKSYEDTTFSDKKVPWGRISDHWSRPLPIFIV